MLGERYNHTLRFQADTQQEGWTKTPQGHVVPTPNTGVPRLIEVKCRMEVEKGLERTVQTEDGTYVKSVFTVYLPKDAVKTEDIPLKGTSVLILDGNQQIGSGPMLRFFRARFNEVLFV